MSHLDEYLDKVQNLPIDVNRYLRLIKEFDLRLESEKLILQELQDSFLQQLRANKEKKGDARKLEVLKVEIEKYHRECIALSQEKMLVSDELYQVVDDSIKDLEGDLKKFEEELRASTGGGNGANNGTGVGNSASSSAGSTLFNSAATAAPSVNTAISAANAASSEPLKDEREEPGFKNKSKIKYDDKEFSKYRNQKEEKLESEIDRRKEQIRNWDADPAEPKYCYCNRHSFGDMVKCDNPFCEEEWFHYECALLTQPPKGKWFCKNCVHVKNHKLIR